jgi:iron-sulfur cluster assembly transcription factor IscR
MQLSTKGRYAVMAMADLSRHGPGSTVPLGTISERQQISLAYLEQLFLKLRRAGLVSGVRGPGGGYTLAREPSAITIAEIMAAVDEPVKMTRCAGEATTGCIGDDRCLTHDLWDALGEKIIDFLDGVTLGDVVDNALAKHMAFAAAEADKASGQAASTEEA